MAAAVAEPRVLFVGNSATYFNDLPEMLRQLVPGLRYAQVTKGGEKLSGHVHDPAVRWMITGDGPAPNASCYPRFSHGESFFDDGEGWDVLVLQDRADSLTDRIRGYDDRLNESLGALDTFASWVRYAAAKMRRRPSVIVFHRCLYDYNECAQEVDIRQMCARGAEGIQQYVARLAMHLGPNVPVSIMPAMDAFLLVREEGPDVFRDLYAGDGEHASRAGSYLMALLFFQLVTGRSPLNAPGYLPRDGDQRQHVDMRSSSDQWISSDAWQRSRWPTTPLPVMTEELAQRLRSWAHRTSSRRSQPGSPTAMWSNSYGELSILNDMRNVSKTFEGAKYPGIMSQGLSPLTSLASIKSQSFDGQGSMVPPYLSAQYGGSFRAPSGGSFCPPSPANPLNLYTHMPSLTSSFATGPGVSPHPMSFGLAGGNLPRQVRSWSW
mmetsp:Transcript_11779/g.19338  ORF Transcript_11779/g.19338 Transcript_11779/m.19338 type:complete len:436 (+) Transcript_11779:40-1347(+)